MMPPKIARLAGLGAYAACAGLLALFALLAYVSRHTATGGITPVLAWVSIISLGVVFAALIAAHVIIGRQLIELSKSGARS